MRGRRGAALGVLCLAALVVPGPFAGLVAQEYHVDTEAERSVVFVSETTLDEFEGTTDRIDGYVLLDGEGVRYAGAVEGELYFEVDLASLDTGISLRDRHMRDNYLHTDEHPYAVFEGSIGSIRETGADAYRVESPGTFTVHGVSRERSISCDVSAVADREAWDVACAFPVALEDHDIEIPRVMFMKLAPEVRLELSFRIRKVG